MNEPDASAVYVEPDNLVTIKLAALVFGLTDRAIEGKIREGHWRAGIEYRRAPDGRIYIDRARVRQWIAGAAVEGGPAPASRRRRSGGRADAGGGVLTRADLEALTGTVQPKRMCAWLGSRGWVFEPPARRGDIPKVSRAYHDARLSGQPLPAAPGAAPARPRVRTDFMLQPTRQRKPEEG